MGNVVVWTPTQTHAAVLLMRLLEEPVSPRASSTSLTGDGIEVSKVALEHRDLAGIHFTGSTKTSSTCGRRSATTSRSTTTYPRLVGETGGKDFLVAHPSADRAVLKTALTRGAFEYRARCSATSARTSGVHLELRVQGGVRGRGRLPDHGRRDRPRELRRRGHRRARVRQEQGGDRPGEDQPACTIVAGGSYDDSVGYFVRPTVVECSDPENEVFRRSTFGPFLAVHVYEDENYDEMLTQMESASDYALTGSVVSGDRAAAVDGEAPLRRGQLLHQRQVDRRRRRPAALRRRPFLRPPTTRRARRRT